MLDVLIIGAGPAGLCAAKTILESEDGNINLRIVDGYKTLGGVWAKENLYPGLTTNNLRGGIDFSDLPMDDSFGVKDGSPIPGEVMHNYLHEYAKKWDILRRIDYETYVEEISRRDSDLGWKVRVRKADNTHHNLETTKLIVATGITDRPHHPRLPDTSSYGCPIIHSAHLGKQADRITSKSVETVSVLGGAKSAYDAVYLAASAGKKVHWIIRASGKGPVWVFPPYAQLGPVKAWRERLPVRRFITCLSPWMWDDGMGRLRSFLHDNWVGKKITQAFWGDIHHATLKDCQYKNEACLNILEPEQSPFWYGTASGVYNYPQPHDLYHYIRTGQVVIHRADITSFSRSTIHLSSSTAIPSSLLITATGFSAQPTITFHPSITHSSLGLPSTCLTRSQTQFWSDLSSHADRVIGAKFPRLVGGPFLSPKSTVKKPLWDVPDQNARYTPWRLWKGVAPPGPTAEGRHDLVFLGMCGNFGSPVRFEIMCLWGWAYLTGELLSLSSSSSSSSSSFLPSTSNAITGSTTITTTTTTTTGRDCGDEHAATSTALNGGGGGSGESGGGEMSGGVNDAGQKEEKDEEISKTKLTPRAQAIIYNETALWARYWHLRAPYGHGRQYPDPVFDQVPVWDMWVADLGLRKWRKIVDEEKKEKSKTSGGNTEQGWTWVWMWMWIWTWMRWVNVGGGWTLKGWLRELFEPYTAADYEGLVAEWKLKRRQRRREAGGGGAAAAADDDEKNRRTKVAE